MGRSGIWVLAFLFSCTLVLGQQPAATKPCSTDAHRAFDFWAGVWDVSTKDGRHVGENEITSQACMLFESWRGDQGSRGLSLNFIDPADGLWTQDWVDNGGGRILIKGGFKDGAMRLVGEHTLPNGEKRPFRGTWTPLADGRVRQHFEEIADEQAGWATWFDGYYARRAFWPTFRGPAHSGVAAGANPPVEWSEDSNVRWKVELEGTGHASPIVWGERIYLMSSAKDAETDVHRFFVEARSLKDGAPVWSTVVREVVPHESLHATASQVSGSPVTDGQHIWAFLGSRGLYCLDMDGKVVWSKDLGTQTTRNAFGEGSSPAVHGDRIVVNWDHEGDSFIVALDKATGEELWRNARDEPTSWSTPLVVRDGERDVVVVSATNSVRGYDLESGEEVWWVSGLGLNAIPTPVADGETVWVMSGYREPHGMAIRYVGAKGDLAGTDSVRWETDRGLSYVPSPVLADGRLFFLQRFSGILSCYTLSTGEACYEQQRIEGYENVYASLVAAGDRVYSVSRDGAAVVFRASGDFEILGRGELDDVFNATPAIVGNSLILRGDRYLYHIAAQ